MRPTLLLSWVGRACVLSPCFSTLVLQAEQTVQVNWQTRSAGCPAKITSSENVKLHVTGINDMIIDLSTNEQLIYAIKVHGTPASVAPPENPFVLQTGTPGACPVNAAQLADQMQEARTVKDGRITPADLRKGGAEIPLSTTLDAISSHKEFTDLLNEYKNDSCKQLFDTASDRVIADWIARFVNNDHFIEASVVLNPDQIYHFYIEESWKAKGVSGAKMDWKCGDSDIWTLSLGPMITTLPYRTYNSVKVPVSSGGNTTTQTVLSVSGNSNVNVMGAALLNLDLPNPTSWDWTGVALSAGPVYAFSSAPNVSKLGIFAGVSIQLYKSFFITPGVHIGEFADYPAGFVPGSVIPPDFGTLTPVTRNVVRFAIGLTYKTSTFKKSTNQGTDANAKVTNSNQKNQSAQSESQQTVISPNTGPQPSTIKNGSILQQSGSPENSKDPN